MAAGTTAPPVCDRPVSGALWRSTASIQNRSRHHREITSTENTVRLCTKVHLPSVMQANHYAKCNPTPALHTTPVVILVGHGDLRTVQNQQRLSITIVPDDGKKRVGRRNVGYLFTIYADGSPKHFSTYDALKCSHMTRIYKLNAITLNKN